MMARMLRAPRGSGTPRPVWARLAGTSAGIILGTGLCCGVASGGMISFQGLGTNARPNAVSANGSTVAGNGFVWHANTGLAALPFTRANGVSADGSIIVGRNGTRAVRWDGNVVRDLNTFGWGEYSTANGVSGDGSVVVGNGATDGDFPETKGYRWTSGNGTQSCGSGITGGLYENWGAIAASNDGSVVVGNQGYTPRAFRWTAGSGPVELFPDLPYSTATGVSSDGSIIAATIATDSPSDRHATRLVLGSSAQVLGELPGGESSSANGISGNGTIVVGLSGSTDGNRAAMWASSVSPQSITNFLSTAGVVGHAGWTLTEATAISSDGSTIVGVGLNASGSSESWVATIPAPASVPLLVAAGVFTMRRRVR